MKYFQQTVNFNYSWEEVSTSNWMKYGPWNEKTPHVIAVDTISRAVDPSTGIVSRFHVPGPCTAMSFMRRDRPTTQQALTYIPTSYAQSASSPADSLPLNGSPPSSVAKTRPWSTRLPTSTLSPRSSHSAP